MACGIHPGMPLLHRAANISLVAMEIYRIEKGGNMLEYPRDPVVCRSHWCVEVVSPTRQVCLVDVIDGIVGVLDKRIVVGQRACPALGRHVRLIMNFVVVHVIIVAYVKPVRGGEDMLPPLVPVCRRFGGVETLCPHWHMSGVLVAQGQNRSDIGVLQL